ncbi:MFS transporter [Tianweitania sediminis]|uniref:MFS transporter n=2 Tax=Tianweitania sediminis TaxID=1502156 RepID=A0A8J7R1G0_9HYPH|nr:MFS transporter [Tianweitania sediminis]
MQAAAPEQPYARRWPMLFILLLAGFMNLIDVTIVNVALPSLQEGLGASSSEIEWVVAAYILAFAIGLLPFGRLGDRIGRKSVFLVGVAGFTLFSAFCGLAPSTGWLIIARVFQGFASAMMMPQVLAIVQVTFPPEERGTAFSLFGLSAGLASVTGPLAGGLLISLDLWGLDWRPIFLVNIPVGLFALWAAGRVVPKLPGNTGQVNDLGGTLLAGASIFLIVFALIEGRGFGWASWIFGLMVLAAVGFVLFYRLQKSRERADLTQLLPAALLRNRNFMLGTTMVLLFFSGVAGFFMVLAIFWQSGLGFTPLESGLTTVPFSIGVLVSSAINGRLKSSFLRQRTAAGALLLAAGMVWLRGVVGAIESFDDHWTAAAPLFVSGIGLGMTISSLFQTVLSNVQGRDAGSGAGALQSFQQVGSALGVAIMGQIFFAVLEGGGPSASGDRYLSAMQTSLIYEIVAFVGVAALVLLLQAPKAPSVYAPSAVPE